MFEDGRPAEASREFAADWNGKVARGRMWLTAIRLSVGHELRRGCVPTTWATLNGGVMRWAWRGL